MLDDFYRSASTRMTPSFSTDVSERQHFALSRYWLCLIIAEAFSVDRPPLRFSDIDMRKRHYLRHGLINIAWIWLYFALYASLAMLNTIDWT